MYFGCFHSTSLLWKPNTAKSQNWPVHEKNKHACSVLPWNDFIVSVETKANNITQVDVLETDMSGKTALHFWDYKSQQ